LVQNRRRGNDLKAPSLIWEEIQTYRRGKRTREALIGNLFLRKRLKEITPKKPKEERMIQFIQTWDEN